MLSCPKCKASVAVPIAQHAPAQPAASAAPRRSVPPTVPDDIVPLPLDAEPPPEPPAPRRKPCPFCAEPVLPEAKRCRHCGETLDVVLRDAERPRGGQNPAGMILGILGGIAVLGGIFAPALGGPLGISISFFDLYLLPLRPEGADPIARIGAFACLTTLGVAGLFAVILAAVGFRRVLVVNGLLTLGVLAYTLLPTIRSRAANGAATLPPLAWGWAVLGIGALLMIVAALVPNSDQDG